MFFNAKHAKSAKILVFSSRSPALAFEGRALRGSFFDLKKTIPLLQDRCSFIIGLLQEVKYTFRGGPALILPPMRSPRRLRL